MIREVVCRQGDFEAEQLEALDCALSSYSINGVSMTLTAGLNCVRYKNGARHTLADYADMAIRTACKRAKLQGEGQMRQQMGHLHGNHEKTRICLKCLPWVGKIRIACMERRKPQRRALSADDKRRSQPGCIIRGAKMAIRLTLRASARRRTASSQEKN